MSTPPRVAIALRTALSRGLLVPLYQLQRRIRPSTRAALLHYEAGMHFRARAASWTERRKREWILNRLRTVLRYANRETVYYRELFRKVGFDPEADFEFADYAKLPVLERTDVQRAGPTLVSATVRSYELRKDATGGSSGTPVEIWTGPEERGWGESGFQWFARRLGLRPGMPVAYLWGHHLDPVASDRLSDVLRDFVHNVTWLDCFRLSIPDLYQYHRQLTKAPPACIVAYAKALTDLAAVIREHGESVTYPTHCLITGAEKLLPHHRALVETVFGCQVHERYGSRDVGLVGVQMVGSNQHEFEIDWPNILVEPETTDTESSILVTKLHADAMPMLRYRIGDVGRFAESARPGDPSFVLHEVLGRDTDRIILPNGSWIDGIEFPHLMKDYPIRDFQVVQAEDASVVVDIVPGAAFTKESGDAILGVLHANLTGVDVSLRIVQDISRSAANKWRPVRTKMTRGIDTTASGLQ